MSRADAFKVSNSDFFLIGTPFTKDDLARPNTEFLSFDICRNASSSNAQRLRV
jgi:hypothetical protein